MTTNRISPNAGHADYEKLQRGPNGRGLCRQCSTEVPAGRRTFCGKKCIEGWRVKTDPSFVRAKLRERDNGVCRVCGLRTNDVRAALGTLREVAVHPYVDGARDSFPELFALLQKAKKILGIESRSTLWDADHIVEVVRGGGECGLENFQTLCVWCHRVKTARLAAELAAERKAKVGT